MTLEGWVYWLLGVPAGEAMMWRDWLALLFLVGSVLFAVLLVWALLGFRPRVNVRDLQVLHERQLQAPHEGQPRVQFRTRCSEPGCSLWVWVHVTLEPGAIRTVGQPVPASDKCWWHHHGKQPPPRM